MKLSEILVVQCKEKNISLEELVKRTKISITSLRKYCKDERIPNAVNLHKISMALDLDYDELYKEFISKRK